MKASPQVNGVPGGRRWPDVEAEGYADDQHECGNQSVRPLAPPLVNAITLYWDRSALTIRGLSPVLPRGLAPEHIGGYTGEAVADAAAWTGAVWGRLALGPAPGLHSHRMTEVPEYLLERSRARRAALGLGGGGDAPAPRRRRWRWRGATPPPTRLPAAAAAPPPRRLLRPDQAEALPTYVAPAGPERDPSVDDAGAAVLPLWAIVYMGAFGEQSTAAGAPREPRSSASSCATCHGAQGQGGVGPALAGGEATQTFPDAAAHASS